MEILLRLFLIILAYTSFPVFLIYHVIIVHKSGSRFNSRKIYKEKFFNNKKAMLQYKLYISTFYITLISWGILFFIFLFHMIKGN